MILRLAAIVMSVTIAWLAWMLAGEGLERLGLDAFDIPGRVAMVFVTLSVLQAAMSRWARRKE